MTSWKTYRLGDITIMRNGKKRPNTQGSYPVYGGNGIMDYADCYNAENTIIVGRVGAYCGNVYQCKNKCWVSDNAISVSANELVDDNYLYYLMSSLDFHHHHIGGAQPLITQDIIGGFEIFLPPLEEQRRIAGILGAIDDKIENNRRINTNLELQAQALYKQWFVDCSIVKLGDVIKTTSGGTPSRSHMEFYAGKYGWVKSKELNGSFITNTEESITDDAIAKSAAKLLPAKSILIAMYGATVGQYAILSQPMTCNQAVCALLPNENYPYTYLFMVAKNIKEELANKAIGSAQQNISQVIIKDIDISSDIEKIKQFHKIVCPHFEVMEKNQKENETLATLRDTLLPKLMNGEIKIAE